MGSTVSTACRSFIQDSPKSRSSPCCLPEIPRAFAGLFQSSQGALLTSRGPQGLCWALQKHTKGSPPPQSAPGLLLAFAKDCKVPRFFPECPGAFAAFFQNLQGALLPSRGPQGFYQALLKPTRGPTAFQTFPGLFLGFAKVHKGSLCLPGS